MGKLERLEQKKNRLDLELIREQNRFQKESRKERTRRLIQKGALAEKYFDIEDLTTEETEELFSTFSSFIKEKKNIMHKKK